MCTYKKQVPSRKHIFIKLIFIIKTNEKLNFKLKKKQRILFEKKSRKMIA